MEIKNAIIKSTSLSKEDHGILSIWLHLDYGGSGQGFGGYSLYSPNFRPYPNITGHFIWRCLEIAGVESWDKLPGKSIRVEANYEKVIRIGNILKDDWFNPTEEFRKIKEEYDKVLRKGK